MAQTQSSEADAAHASNEPAFTKTEDSAVTLRYAVYVHGIHILDAEGAYVLRPWGYGGKARLYTVGLASWFLTLDIHAETQGRFEDGKTEPLEYDSYGLSRKKQRHAHIKFDKNGPHLTLLTPKDRERDPLPDDKLKTSMDILSGLATLFQSLSVTGKCDVAGTIYDGLRLTHIEAHGPVDDKIPQTHDSSYSGEPAKRCDFIGYQIAGFPKNSHHKQLLSTPQPGKAWFLTLKDYGIVPVKIQFHHPKAGDIELVMQSVPSTAKMEVPARKQPPEQAQKNLQTVSPGKTSPAE